MKKIAVVIAGCGFQDGAEITESVSTLIALSEAGVEYQVFAPEEDFTATDHLSGQATETRNLLKESARIARGQVKSLKELKADDFDAVVFPGGFGAALHLSNWAQKGSQCEVHPEAERIVKSFRQQDKPIAAFCIAPTLLAKVLGTEGVTLTIGNDPATSQEIEKTGALHENCAVDDYITDRDHKIITSPAYMYEAKPFEVFTGIRKAIKELVEMA